MLGLGFLALSPGRERGGKRSDGEEGEDEKEEEGRERERMRG